jgi:hypothetical protein
VDLANRVWGVDHIRCVIDLIVNILQGAAVDLNLPDKMLKPCWESHFYGGHHTSASRETNVVLAFLAPWQPFDNVITVRVMNPAVAPLEVRISRHLERVLLLVSPRSDDAVEVIALVQAILEGGLAQYVHEAGKLVEVRIEAHGREDVSDVGLRSQIAPLWSVASRYTSEDQHLPVRDGVGEETVYIGKKWSLSHDEELWLSVLAMLNAM